MSGTANPPTSRSRRSSRTFSLQPGSIAPITGARALGHFRRQRDDRPHFARRFHQENVARREISHRERRDGGGFQQLRFAPRQRPRDDARHVRQCPHQKPDAGRPGRRRHAVAARRQKGFHLRRLDGIPEARHAARRDGRAGIRHRFSRATGPRRARTCSA